MLTFFTQKGIYKHIIFSTPLLHRYHRLAFQPPPYDGGLRVRHEGDRLHRGYLWYFYGYYRLFCIGFWGEVSWSEVDEAPGGTAYYGYLHALLVTYNGGLLGQHTPLYSWL